MAYSDLVDISSVFVSGDDLEMTLMNYAFTIEHCDGCGTSGGMGIALRYGKERKIVARRARMELDGHKYMDFTPFS